MTIPLRLEIQLEGQSPQDALQGYSLPTELIADRLEFSTAELAFRVLAAFRSHPHITNVLTHISRAKWTEVEHALNRILDLSTARDDLSPLEENIIDLMVGERGVTGKILKPYFQASLHKMVGPNHAQRLIHHVNALYLELEWKVQHPPPPIPISADEPIQEASHALE